MSERLVKRALYRCSIELRNDNWKRAEEKYNEAREIAEEIGLNNIEAQTLTNLIHIAENFDTRKNSIINIIREKLNRTTDAKEREHLINKYKHLWYIGK